MNTLDKDIELIVDLTDYQNDLTGNTIYNYNLYMVRGEERTLVFNGKCWINAGETVKRFRINDLLQDLKEGFDNVYSKALAGSFNNDVLLYEKFVIDLRLNDDITLSSNEVSVYLAYDYPNYKRYLQKEFAHRNNMGDTKVYNLLQGDLLPHIPYTANFPFLYTFQYSNDITDSVNFTFSGDVESEPVYIPVPDNKLPQVYGTLTDELFEDTTLTGNGDSTLSVNYGNGDWVDITDECNIYLAEPLYRGDDWYYNEETGNYELFQPEWIECGDSNDNYFFVIYPEELYNTEWKVWDGTQTIEFTPEYEDNFLIICGKGAPCWNAQNIIIENPERFVGTKTVRLSCKYKYDDDRYQTKGLLREIKVEILEPTVKVLDVAKIDICPANYYLVWQDRYGSYQTQPFNKTCTFSESFDFNSVIDYRNRERHTNISITPKWKINTGWIEEKLYPYYESIFTNDNLLLFDTENGKSYIVNVTDKSYTEKTIRNQGKKLFNLELNVEENRKQNILH